MLPPLTPIVCFGEALWDVLPTGRQPGGAPCNVALHLHQLGQPMQLISRVGDDELGRELLGYLSDQGLDTTLVQHSRTHLTGMVKPNVCPAGGAARCNSVQPLAWDYIHCTDTLRQAVEEARTLVYGTVAARSPTSRETLYRLLPHAAFKVLDLNLRAPHYAREVVKYLLQWADFLKLNAAELAEVMAWHGRPAAPETALPWLAGHFGLQAVCLTQGAAGASLFAGGAWWHSPGFEVAVADPISCGDAFLAALPANRVAGRSPAVCLHRACAAGAMVASRHGTTPSLTTHEPYALLNTT